MPKKKQLPKMPYGEGTFNYTVKNGKEYIKYQKNVGVKRKKRITVYGNTVQECLAAMKTKEQEYIERERITSVYEGDNRYSGTLEESMSVWLYNFKKADIGKSRSFDTIESTFNTHIKNTSLGRHTVLYITALDLKRHINELMSTKSMSTVKKVHSLLNQFFSYYYASDIVHNPMNMVKLPSKKKETALSNIDISIFDESQPVLSDDEIELITTELSKPPCSGKVGYKYGHALLFLMWSFMRYGEAMALQWKDIDMETSNVKIYKNYSKIKERDKNGKPTGNYIWVLSTPKSKSSIRQVVLHKNALDNLLAFAKT